MSLRIVSTPITGSPLAQVALERRSPEWFAAAPSTAKGWEDRARLMRSSLLHEDWLAALAPAFGSGTVASDRLERAATSGFVVTAGQQPGLFGGPLYTWWKALTALAVADRLQELTGMPVAPVFWAATDDSDFAESATTVVATAVGAERIEMPEPPGVGVALARVRLGDVSAQLLQLARAGGSAPDSALVETVRDAYRADATIGGAYVSLLREILEPLGISVLDAADRSVRTAAHPLLKQALDKAEAIDFALGERSRSLKDAGFSTQVNVVDGRSLAFSESEGKRERIRVRDAASMSRSAAPGSLGPNVLLRPIVERSILPTVAYLGGPAEIAYFAQVSAVADVLDVPAPVVLPRWSGYVVEPRIDRILVRHGLEVENFRDPHAVETRLARKSLPDGIASGIEKLRVSLSDSLEEIANAEDGGLVPTAVLDGLRRNVEHRITRLERRLSAGIKRRGNDSLRDVAIARGALFPFGVPQERSLNLMPLLARYGDELTEAVLREIHPHATRIT